MPGPTSRPNWGAHLRPGASSWPVPSSAPRSNLGWMRGAMSKPTGKDTWRAENLARQLEQLWRRGERPDVQHFLAAAPAVAPAPLLAVLRVDQRERWRSGE